MVLDGVAIQPAWSESCNACLCPPPNSYVVALTASIAGFQDGDSKEVTKVK